MPSFDIVSEYDQHELNNAVDQANREVSTRFDFKGTGSRFELDEAQVTLHTQSEFQLQQMYDVFCNKLVKRGIDMMDCVLPSRSGRTGQVFTPRGAVNIKNARHQDDPRPLDETCSCPACSNYSRAYLHHVFRSQEIISSMLLTWHNLHYYQDLMAQMRAAIAQGGFEAWNKKFHAQRALGDIEPL